MRVRVPVAFPVSAACTWLVMARPLAAAAQEPIRIHVDGPRPVAAAVLAVEKRVGRIVTYEDTSYVHPSDIVDVTGQVRRDGDLSKRVFGMRSGTIDVTFTPPAAPVDEQIRQLLDQVLATSRAADNTGDFTVVSRPGAFHVVPIARKGMSGGPESYVSPLDVRVTVSCANENGVQFVERFGRAVSAATGRTIGPGMFPMNLFVQRQVDVCGVAESARDMLWRALQSIRRDLSWQLLCGVGRAGSCSINIHRVPPQ